MIKTLAGGLLAATTLFGMVSLAEAKTLKVVASFDILADVVKNVGGDNVEVTSLVPTGGDPHEFEPSPADAKKLASADVVFVSGFGFEGWLDRLVSASGYKGDLVVVSDGIKPREIVGGHHHHHHDHDEDGHDHDGGSADHHEHADADHDHADEKSVSDPHVWNSAANVGVWVQNIEKALVKADPEDASAIEANAERYGKEVADLDAYAHKSIDAVPAEKRKVLISHDAFGYFGRDYGLTFLSPVGISTEAEASAGDVAKLIDQIKKEGIKVYFFESSNDPRLVRQIAEATGAEPGGELYVEALSAKDGPASDYLKLFKYNVDQVVAGISK